MPEIDFEVKPGAEGDVTVEEMEKVRGFIDTINYLEAEGFIRIEVDEDGEPRLYPAD